MNQAIQFQNASLPHTTSSESPTIRREVSPVAPTNYGNVLRIECAVVYPPIPNRYADLNSLVNKYESNALRRDALIDARGRLAESLDNDGTTLATLRLSRGMSQTKLAELIGTSQSRLSLLESGGEMMFTTFEKLVIALETSRDKLALALDNTGK